MNKLQQNLFSLLYTYSSIQSLLNRLGDELDIQDENLVEDVDKRVEIYKELIIQSNLQEEYSIFAYQADEW